MPGILLSVVASGGSPTGVTDIPSYIGGSNPGFGDDLSRGASHRVPLQAAGCGFLVIS